MVKTYYDFSGRKFSEISKKEIESLEEGDVFVCQAKNYDLLNDWIFCVGMVTEVKTIALAIGKFKTAAWATRFAQTIAEGREQ